MTNLSRLSRIFLSWELPIAAEHEDEAIKGVAGYGTSLDLEPDDFALVLAESTDAWLSVGLSDPTLRASIDAALKFTPQILESVDSNTYFDIFQKLRTGDSKVPGLSATTSRRLLSRYALIAHLLSEECFSCSQVARLLSAIESTLDVPYGAISVLARGLQLLPKLDPGRVTAQLLEKDKLLSLTLFPDSTVFESSAIAELETSAWLPEVNVAELLNRLVRSNQADSATPWPYLQILHWCLTPIEFFDHPASYLYEFNPRGKHVAAKLFSLYPAVTGNPVLNNAKAVPTLNSSWARNRGGDDAHALVTILESIESLPFAPRQQTARVLRAWLFRVIELRTVLPVPIDSPITMELVSTVTDFVVGNETNTQGVIEQRVVDYLCVLAYSSPGWRPHGLGDGVNASNLSRHKLGDIEFTNVDLRKAVAIEAHGGYLSVTYVTDHTRSLARIIRQRLDDSWANLDDPEAWSIQVVFVCHSRASVGLPQMDTVHGVRVAYDYIGYDELSASANERSTDNERISAFSTFVVDALNASTVRESTRDAFRAIARPF